VADYPDAFTLSGYRDPQNGTVSFASGDSSAILGATGAFAVTM